MEQQAAPLAKRLKTDENGVIRLASPFVSGLWKHCAEEAASAVLKRMLKSFEEKKRTDLRALLDAAGRTDARIVAVPDITPTWTDNMLICGDMQIDLIMFAAHSGFPECTEFQMQFSDAELDAEPINRPNVLYGR
jgi:hypothetical protein